MHLVPIDMATTSLEKSGAWLVLDNGDFADLRERTLLGTKGIATRGKEATSSSWPYY